MKTIENEILINASADKVWDALVNSEKTRIYMYGCDALTDWKVGSTLLWEGSYNDQRMVFVSGFVLAIEPLKLLKYNVIDPNAKYPHTPENHLNCTYTLEEKGDKILLKVVQDGFDIAEDGEKRYQDVYNDGKGWGPILEQIKTICEA